MIHISITLTIPDTQHWHPLAKARGDPTTEFRSRASRGPLSLDQSVGSSQRRFECFKCYAAIDTRGNCMFEQRRPVRDQTNARIICTAYHHTIIIEPLNLSKLVQAGVPVIISKVHRFLTKRSLSQCNRGREPCRAEVGLEL